MLYAKRNGLIRDRTARFSVVYLIKTKSNSFCFPSYALLTVYEWLINKKNNVFYLVQKIKLSLRPLTSLTAKATLPASMVLPL